MQLLRGATSINEADWSVTSACSYLGLPKRRFERWRRRSVTGDLADSAPGGNRVHQITPAEQAEILSVFKTWAEVDRSHRKLAHRGSWLNRFWCSPVTVRRVLDRHDLRFHTVKRTTKREKRPWPQWVEEAPNRVWIYDTTHWSAAGAATTVIEDVVTHKWVADITSVDETSIESHAVFTRALRDEGLIEHIKTRNGDNDTG